MDPAQTESSHISALFPAHLPETVRTRAADVLFQLRETQVSRDDHALLVIVPPVNDTEVDALGEAEVFGTDLPHVVNNQERR